MLLLPKVRRSGIVVQEIENEVLVYDLKTHKAFCLNETSSIIFNHCDGKRSAKELKRTHQLTDEIIYLALDQFKKEN